MKPDYSLCVQCKGGRNLCGLGFCPHLQKISYQNLAAPEMKQEVFGPSPPNVFVGHYNYPVVNWGPMVSLGQNSDTPSDWYGLEYGEVIKQRSMLVRGSKAVGVKTRERVVLEAQEAVMSLKSVDLEVRFTKKPVFNMSFSSVLQPMGAVAPLDKMRVVDNPTIPRKVDSVVGEGLKAEKAIRELSSKGYENYYLMKLLTAGILGAPNDRKLVPTRWGITATDDMLAKQLMEKIRDYRELGEFTVFSNEYLHNHFEILLMPGAWEYEGFEAWAPGTVWTMGASEYGIVEEHERFEGRTKYADKQGGGYYAARFGVCEGLDIMKRQARAVVFREIDEGYMLPMGVWVIRETVKKAFEKGGKKFATRDEALMDIASRLRIPMKTYFKESFILRQRRLTDF
ncbi:MAG: Nre family DNA repair protein [Candidatus Micrarchaeota archaeon]